MKITVSTLVAAPLPEVWLAYTTPEDIKVWEHGLAGLAHDGGHSGSAAGRQVLLAHGGQGRFLRF